MTLKVVLPFLFLVAGLVGCDHATKQVAQDELRGEPPVVLLSGVLDLSYTENDDVGFSALRFIPEDTRRPLIIGVNMVIIPFFLIWWFRRRGAPIYEQAAFAFIISGALGNIVERIIRGFVIDFIHVHYWPIFNAADIYITVGAILLILVTWTRGRRESLPAQ